MYNKLIQNLKNFLITMKNIIINIGNVNNVNNINKIKLYYFDHYLNKKYTQEKEKDENVTFELVDSEFEIQIKYHNTNTDVPFVKNENVVEFTVPEKDIDIDILPIGVGRVDPLSGFIFDEPTNIKDSCTVYFGGRKASGKLRLVFNEENFKPWVVWKFANGDIKWTYDGFTFLDMEFKNSNNEKVLLYETFKGDACKYATKNDWSEWLDMLFANNEGLHALDNCIENQKRVIGNPGFQHYINIMIPSASTYQNYWGVLNGKILDFRSGKKMIDDGVPYTDEILIDHQNDRVNALKWWVDEVINRFNNANFKNIKLNGFYWMEEDNHHGTTLFTDAYLSSKGKSFDLMSRVADYVHLKNYEISWAPYATAPGHSRGYNGHFDHVFMQTGYTIKNTVDFSRVTTILNNCAGYDNYNDLIMYDTNKIYRRGFCFEFCNYSLADSYFEILNSENVAPIYRERLAEVLQYFEEHNLFDKRFAHTYYDDAIYLYLVANRYQYAYYNSNPKYKIPIGDDIVETVDKIMNHIAERKK